MDVCERSEMVMMMEIDGEDCCTTPKRRECRIPQSLACPPPPRKKAAAAAAKRQPPKNGYFQPPDLDSLFVLMPSSRRHQACA